MIGKLTMAFQKGQSWCVLKSWYRRGGGGGGGGGGGPEQGFRGCFTDGLKRGELL